MEELERLLGHDGVVTDPATLLTFECDALTSHRAVPAAVLFPRTTEQVALVARALAQAQVPYVPRGAGTGLSGGALALGGAVVVSLTRMDRILEVDAADLRARLQPGVVNATLAAALAPHGLTFAPDPSSGSVCTLGGNVAENAGGPHCLKYGTTVNHIAALTVVLPDGEVVRLGGPGEQQGLDLVGLFVGSEGTFGIATEIEVKLRRLPESVVTLLAIFDQVEHASASASAFIAAGLIPAALELIDGESIRAVEASKYAVGCPQDAGAVLVIELDGAKASLGRLAGRAREICLACGAREVRIAADDADRERMWQARKKIYAVVAALAPDLMVQDVVVPRARLADIVREIYRIAARHRITMVTAAHLGDGNIHPTMLFDRRDAELVGRVEKASEEILAACVAAGGSITGEHGIGVDKREHLGLMFGDRVLEAMCGVRAVWNPGESLNPGKVIPLRNCREWVGSQTGKAHG